MAQWLKFLFFSIREGWEGHIFFKSVTLALPPKNTCKHKTHRFLDFLKGGGGWPSLNELSLHCPLSFIYSQNIFVLVFIEDQRHLPLLLQLCLSLPCKLFPWMHIWMNRLVPGGKSPQNGTERVSVTSAKTFFSP